MAVVKFFCIWSGRLFLDVAILMIKIWRVYMDLERKFFLLSQIERGGGKCSIIIYKLDPPSEIWDTRIKGVK